MNIAYFPLDFSNLRNDVSGRKIHRVPTLNAYAIEHSSASVEGGPPQLEGQSYSIVGDEVNWDRDMPIGTDDYGVLTIFHRGIKTYELLFPNSADPALKTRLGAFYQESELAFDSGAWLSYALTSGAVFEGLLFSKIGKNLKFHELISEAVILKYIDPGTEKVMERTREARNLVHAGRYKEDFVSRAEALEMRTTLDKIIKEFAK